MGGSEWVGNKKYVWKGTSVGAGTAQTGKIGQREREGEERAVTR